MILKGEHINKRFIRQRADSNTFYAVETTDFALEAGKITVVSGPSGSGKSTLMNMMAGLLTPTEGKVYLDDEDIYSLDDGKLSELRYRHIGYIPQGQSAVHTLTVLENVLLPRALYKEDDDEAAAAARELLRITGTAELENVLPSQLSGGEIRRMAIARALIADPEIILADEPTSDLDEDNTAIVMQIFRKLSAEGKAVMIVTHDAAVQKQADVLLDMRAGKLSVKQEVSRN